MTDGEVPTIPTSGTTREEVEGLINQYKAKVDKIIEGLENLARIWNPFCEKGVLDLKATVESPNVMNLIFALAHLEPTEIPAACAQFFKPDANTGKPSIFDKFVTAFQNGKFEEEKISVTVAGIPLSFTLIEEHSFTPALSPLATFDESVDERTSDAFYNIFAQNIIFGDDWTAEDKTLVESKLKSFIDGLVFGPETE